MFIRFVSGEIDEDSHVSAGLFCAAFRLLDQMVLFDHEYAAVARLMGWFRLNLRGPSEYRQIQVLAQPFADMRPLL